MDNWVKLNVGGQLFLTSRTTLLKAPDSMLFKLFAGESMPSAKDEQGAFLIDRTPEYFKPILNYLRTGELVIDSGVNVKGVLAEAKFFGIQSLIDQYEESKKAEKNTSMKKNQSVSCIFEWLVNSKGIGKPRHGMVKEKDISRFFEKFGEILFVSHRSSGAYEIVFAKNEDAKRAIDHCNDDTNFGRPLFEILYVNAHGRTEFGCYEFNLYSKNYLKLVGSLD